jgi:hypothetical protein
MKKPAAPETFADLKEQGYTWFIDNSNNHSLIPYYRSFLLEEEM